MTNLKKLSLLGLVLMSASAITAAIIPNQKNDNTSKLDPVPGDSQTQSFDAGGRGATMTCAFTQDKTAGQTCDIEANSGTTNGDPNTSNIHGTNTTLI